MITKHFTKVQKHKGETSIFEVMNDMLILFFFFPCYVNTFLIVLSLRKNLCGFLLEKKKKNSQHAFSTHRKICILSLGNKY